MHTIYLSTFLSTSIYHLLPIYTYISLSVCLSASYRTLKRRAPPARRLFAAPPRPCPWSRAQTAPGRTRGSPGKRKGGSRSSFGFQLQGFGLGSPREPSTISASQAERLLAFLRQRRRQSPPVPALPRRPGAAVPLSLPDCLQRP